MSLKSARGTLTLALARPNLKVVCVTTDVRLGGLLTRLKTYKIAGVFTEGVALVGVSSPTAYDTHSRTTVYEPFPFEAFCPALDRP